MFSTVSDSLGEDLLSDHARVKMSTWTEQDASSLPLGMSGFFNPS